MNPTAIPMLLFIALGLVLAVAFDLFNKKVAFAKTHGQVTFFGQLAIIVAAAAAAIHFTHDWNNWLTVLIGFFIVLKINEARDNRQKLRDQCAEYQARATAALAEANRTGRDSAEIDVSKAPGTVLNTLINTRKKQGLTVETVKNESTGSLTLRLSRPASSGK